MLDEDSLIAYHKGVLQLQREKKENLQVAANRRRLRLESIESCFEAEELASLQDFENKRILLFDKFKGDLEKKISQVEQEMYAYNEKKRAELNQNPQKKHVNRYKKSYNQRKRKPNIKGPFIVYMLKDEEIEEDLKTIKWALRNRALSPDVEEHSIDLFDNSIHNTSPLITPPRSVFSMKQKLMPNDNFPTEGNIQYSSNLKTYLKKTTDKLKGSVYKSSDSSLRTKIKEVPWSAKAEETSASTIKQPSPQSISLSEETQSSNISDFPTSPMPMTESCPENQHRFPETCSNIPITDTICCSYSTAVVYYGNQNVLDVAGNRRAVRIRTQTEIEYSDGATQSFSTLPIIGGSIGIYATHREIVYYSSGESVAVPGVVMAPFPVACSENDWYSVDTSDNDTSQVVTVPSVDENYIQPPLVMPATQTNEEQLPYQQVECYQGSQLREENNSGNENYSHQQESVEGIENVDTQTTMFIPPVDNEDPPSHVAYYCDITNSDVESLNSPNERITVIPSTDEENLENTENIECEILNDSAHQIENLQLL